MTGPSGERELVDRARRGDRAAFEALFRANRDQVFGLALRLTGDPVMAEDVLIDSFVAAWTELQDFRGDSRFSTWVSGIAVNHSRQARRARGRRDRRFAPLDAAATSPPLSTGDVPAVERQIELERAIAELPAGAREALLLRHVQGLSCAETAAVLNVTVGTVKSQTSRACALLRKKLTYE